MTATSTTYTIHEYATGEAIGEITMTDEQYGRYMRDAQQPEGLVRLDSLPKIDYLSVTMDGDTTVYLD